MKYLSRFGKFLYSDDRSLKKRIPMALCACLSFVLTFMLLPIVEVFLANTRFFEYTVAQALVPVSVFALAAFAVLFGISFALKGRLFNWYVSLLLGLAVAGYAQTLFMNSSVGLLDGTEIQWNNYSTSAVIGLVVWGVIIFAVMVMPQLSKKLWHGAVIYLTILICVMQVVNVAAVAFSSEIDSKTKYAVTSDGQLELSDKHNVIVLTVDTFALDYAEEVMQNSPEYFDEFDGFTWYKNTMSHYSRTFPSVAYLFTGEEYYYEKPYDEYMEAAWEDNTILEDMNDAGYAVRVYAYPKYVNTDLEYMTKYTENYKEVESGVDWLKLEKELITLSLYRTAPVALKPFFETDTTQINSAYTLEDNKTLSTTDTYFYQRMCKEKLTTDSELGEKGTFTYYHFKGCHAPYQFDENCIKTDEKVTIKEATRGALTNVGEYLRQLKELGIYDSSTIIIAGDHARSGTITELDKERVVSLFYKPAGSTGEIEVNNSPQQLINITATVLRDMGLDYSGFGTPMDEVKEGDDVVRYFYMSGASEDLSMREGNLITYEVTGDARDFSNWKIVDKIKIEYPFLEG